MKVELLKRKIREKGYRLDFIAEQLNLSRYGFSLKINGVNEFKWGEVEKIVKILRLDQKEKDEIFFN